MSANAPEKKPTSIALIAVGVILGPALAIAVFVGVMSGFADYEKVAGAFVREVAAGHPEAAYLRMATPYRSMVPLERFRASLSRNAWFRGASGVSFNRTVSNSGGSYAAGTMQRADGEVQVRVYFVEEGDTEKITNFVVGGMNAVPSPADGP